MVVRRKYADGIRRFGIARQQKSLTAAATKIIMPAITRPAWLLHPGFAPESLKSLRLPPYPLKVMLSDAGKLDAGNYASGMTW